MTGNGATNTSSPADKDIGLGLSSRVLFIVFTISGISALIYQLIWQRSLLTIYGSNIESVTMVVSAFMLGLGIGSIFGGAISKKAGAPLLLFFSLIEFGIGLYGALSLHLFHYVGEFSTGVGTLATGILSFSLILIPTVLMGSTLPLLVAHYVNASKSVGFSVSMLYFVNTLGAGIGAFVAAFFLLGTFGLSGTTYVAVALNFTAGGLILLFKKKSRTINFAS